MDILPVLSGVEVIFFIVACAMFWICDENSIDSTLML